MTRALAMLLGPNWEKKKDSTYGKVRKQQMLANM